MKTKSIKLALDWTPNTNHTGFFIAQEKGFYNELGLDLEIISPQSDNYSKTPVKKLELGEVDFAICPLESVLSYRVKSVPFEALVIANIFQEDLSAIVTLAYSDLNQPQKLDGKTYASYAARYEDHIVKEMIKNDGGNGEPILIYPEKLGIWETLLSGKAEATWIFRNWEGLEAKKNDIELHEFKMNDFGVPYGFSPVVVANSHNLQEHPEIYEAFLEATKRGFIYAQEQPEETVEILKKYVPLRDQLKLSLLESQLFTNAYYGTQASFGTVDALKMQNFLDWLTEKRIEKRNFKVDELVWDKIIQQELTH